MNPIIQDNTADLVVNKIGQNLCIYSTGWEFGDISLPFLRKKWESGIADLVDQFLGRPDDGIVHR